VPFLYWFSPGRHGAVHWKIETEARLPRRVKYTVYR
jgi:hypothetical protein